MQVILKVTYSIDVGATDAAYLAEVMADYQPTDENPEPGEEWIAEEIAMRRCSQQGMDEVLVLETIGERER